MQSEVTRAREFLETGGRSLLRTILAARDQLSAEMEFEEAARQHRRLEKVEEVLKMRDDLAGNVEPIACRRRDSLGRAECGGSVPPSRRALAGGARIGFELEDGKPVSIDRKLREAWAMRREHGSANRERQERLAVLARWFYSTWCDGELLVFPDFNDPPVRKLVNAISRVSGKRAPDAGVLPRAEVRH